MLREQTPASESDTLGSPAGTPTPVHCWEARRKVQGGIPGQMVVFMMASGGRG